MIDGLLDLGDLWSLTELPRPSLEVEAMARSHAPSLAAPLLDHNYRHDDVLLFGRESSGAPEHGMPPPTSGWRS